MNKGGVTMVAIKDQALQAKEAAKQMVKVTTEEKNHALLQVADALMIHEQEILAANEKDLQKGEEAGLTKALLDRLALNHKRIEAMAEGLRSVVNLPDPIGNVMTNIRPQN